MPPEMGHVSLVTHKSLAAVITAEWKISSVTALVTDQFITVTKLLLTVVTLISKVKLVLLFKGNYFIITFSYLCES